MAMTERDVARLTGVCVHDFGREVSLSEFKNWLDAGKNYDFDDDDLRLSPSRRNECRYQQIVRNMRCHNTRVTGVPIREIGFGSYFRWLDGNGYLIGNLDEGTQPSEIDVYLRDMQAGAVAWFRDRTIACLGGRRLDWVNKIREADDGIFDLVVPNASDEGRTCTLCRVLSTTHKWNDSKCMDVHFDMSDELVSLCKSCSGFDIVKVVVVCDPIPNQDSFKYCLELTADEVMARMAGGRLWV